MTRRTAVSALADVTAALVDSYDVVSTLTDLTRACAEVLDAGAAGILVLGPLGSQAGSTGQALELLAASSHAAAELEAFQGQVREGPCLDAIAGNADVSARTTDELTDRWPRMGAAVAASGFCAVHAVPLRWRGSAFGALNVFLPTERELDAGDATAARAFADVATLAIVHARATHDGGRIVREIQDALEGRIVVEQAKGVVAVQEGVHPGDAFHLLVERATRDRMSLTQVAAQVVASAEQAARWSHEAHEAHESHGSQDEDR
jgi:hypothetical protein